MEINKKVDLKNKFQGQQKKETDQNLLIKRIFEKEFIDKNEKASGENYRNFLIKEISLLNENELADFFHEIILDKSDFSINVTFKFKRDL